MIAFVYLLSPAERASPPQDRILPSCFDPTLLPLWTAFMRNPKTRSGAKGLNTLVDRWGFLLHGFLSFVRDQGIYPFRHDGEEAEIQQVRTFVYRQRRAMLTILTGKWLSALKPFPLSRVCQVKPVGQDMYLIGHLRFSLPSSARFSDLAGYLKHRLRFVGSATLLARRIQSVNFMVRRVTDSMVELRYSILLPPVSPRAFGKDVSSASDLAQAIMEGICLPVLRSNPVGSIPRRMIF